MESKPQVVSIVALVSASILLAGATLQTYVCYTYRDRVPLNPVAVARIFAHVALFILILALHFQDYRYEPSIFLLFLYVVGCLDLNSLVVCRENTRFWRVVLYTLELLAGVNLAVAAALKATARFRWWVELILLLILLITHIIITCSRQKDTRSSLRHYWVYAVLCCALSTGLVVLITSAVTVCEWPSQLIPMVVAILYVLYPINEFYDTFLPHTPCLPQSPEPVDPVEVVLRKCCSLQTNQVNDPDFTRKMTEALRAEEALWETFKHFANFTWKLDSSTIGDMIYGWLEDKAKTEMKKYVKGKGSSWDEHELDVQRILSPYNNTSS